MPNTFYINTLLAFVAAVAAEPAFNAIEYGDGENAVADMNADLKALYDDLDPAVYGGEISFTHNHEFGDVLILQFDAYGHRFIIQTNPGNLYAIYVQRDGENIFLSRFEHVNNSGYSIPDFDVTLLNALRAGNDAVMALDNENFAGTQMCLIVLNNVQAAHPSEVPQLPQPPAEQAQETNDE